MNNRMLATPLVVAAVLALAACSSPQSGSPAPSTSGNAGSSTSTGSTSNGGPSSNDPLASINPCSLISPSVISKNQLQQQPTPPVPGGRGCRWQKPSTGANLDGYDVEVDIYDTSGLSGMNTSGMIVSDNSVGSRQGKLLQYTALGSCILGIGVTPTSRVDIESNASGGDIATSCKLVKQIAPAVAQNLPAGNG